MYLSIGHNQGFSHWLFRWINLWVGGTERAIATTLVIWAPDILAGFVGGWVLLKVAANWQRRSGAEYGQRHLLALVGSAVSFAVAIAAGFLQRTSSLAAWAI